MAMINELEMNDLTTHLSRQVFLDVKDCLDYPQPKWQNAIILIQECAELTHALTDAMRPDKEENISEIRANIIEEMAHVLLSCEIVSKEFGITTYDLQNEIDKKRKKHGLIKDEKKARFNLDSFLEGTLNNKWSVFEIEPSEDGDSVYLKLFSSSNGGDKDGEN